MFEPRLHHVNCLDSQGLHRMAYWEWGDAANPRVVVCVHGLTRQGRDFDALARVLAPDWRVICPDVVGRGQSDWLHDPMGYQVPAYVADMVTLIARLGVERVSWVGTSMGGLIGLALAALPGSPVERLVLNDIGPTLQFDALQRIGTYLGAPVRFASEAQAADYLWTISSSFGPHSREQWLALTRPQLQPAPEGGFMPHYDPAIGVPFKAITAESTAAGEALLWATYDRLRCATLLLRGATSDLLTHATAMEMTQRGPRARLVEIEGVGHAPTLVAEDQQRLVADFLAAPLPVA